MRRRARVGGTWGADFKVEGGLNWPRRFRTMIGTDIGEDMRSSRYQINPKFDAKKFDVER